MGKQVCIKWKSGRNEYGVWKIITVVCVIYVQKHFQILNINQAVIDNISFFFQDIALNLHIHKNRIFIFLLLEFSKLTASIL